ncbi:hypothetical protein M2232_003040 [Bradyrhizobium japonicum]|uniref:hypothetical protein n=2 Tax=Bradyrhizobium japonicum TaxID=375 RepID=UPI002225CFAE|nr:hypothetical protein [Bradyrhizobium japonicum]MCW2219508.1 hypothetical protein [Bradyrhizobium japonicum]MCW2344122.1 hypothetical protein [Bradyrhizobium japonicum]
MSVAKRALQGEMPADMRLDFLTHLEKMIDNVVTAEIIAMIEPMDDDGYELFREIQKLGYGPMPNALDMLAKKFDVFARCNPSLRRAYDAATSGRYERAM